MEEYPREEKGGLHPAVIVVVLLAITAVFALWIGKQKGIVVSAVEAGSTFLPHGDGSAEPLAVGKEKETEPEETETSAPVQPQLEPQVRILIQAGDYASLYHDKIQITSDSEYKISYSDQEEAYPGDRITTIEASDERLKNGVIRVTAVAGIQLPSVHRECGYPLYPGVIEIRADKNGMVVINELGLEEYLKRVVPGEMPLNYGREALKVQAVCARSYAWNKLTQPGYPEYGAHMDDSVNFQVYNNQTCGEEADLAVEETRGQVLVMGDQVVDTYYFSVSCGTTTDMSIWEDSPEDYPCYPAASMAVSRKTLDLTEESAFRGFIDWYDDSYDAQADLYRWSIVLKMEDITSSVNSYLTSQGQPELGLVQSLEVTKRGSGGIIETLTVNGQRGKAELSHQAAVRQALGHSGMVVRLPDGRNLENWKMLPSAFFYLEEVRDSGGIAGYVLHGGGYGHGVGMSQSAVNGMVQSGSDYQSILNYFYPQTSIEKAY